MFELANSKIDIKHNLNSKLENLIVKRYLKTSNKIGSPVYWYI